MERDPEAAPASYRNRPPAHQRPSDRGAAGTAGPRRASGRAMDRMLTVLRGYEQRAQRRAALHAWVLARRSAAAANVA